MAPARSSPYASRLVGVNTKNATSVVGHHISACLRAARRHRQGPQARAAQRALVSRWGGAGRSEAKSLDDAEHSSTLTHVMAEAA